jgi:hypothetical protein
MNQVLDHHRCQSDQEPEQGTEQYNELPLPYVLDPEKE